MDNPWRRLHGVHAGVVDLWSMLASLAGMLAALVPHGPWVQTLGELDAARDQAFVRADTGALRDVYTAGSPELAADRRMLRAFEQRGLEVDRVSLRLLDVEVLSERSRRVRLRVLDRLEPVRVREPGGPWRVLPRDEPTERTILLERTPDGWRIRSATRLAG